MHCFHYQDGKLFCEEVSMDALARKYGTPLYVYSYQTLAAHFNKLNAALAPIDHQIFFAMKANSNLGILKSLADLGSGFDIVSGGELRKVMAAGGDPGKCVFAGVAKTEAEIELALSQGIYCFNAESEAELIRINAVAERLGKIAPVAVRVNPNVDAHTHHKITTGTYENKFGIQFELVEDVYARAAQLKNLRLRGVEMHIGSQLTDVAPFEMAVQKISPLAKTLLAKYGIEFLSIGGGLGIVYDPALASGSPAWWQTPSAAGILTPEMFASRLIPLLQPLGLKILVEPGRFIVGNAGALVTRVEYVKKTGSKNFVIVDAAMNDLIRPALYDSRHEIVPLIQSQGVSVESDVVGGICESGDYFAKDRPLAKVGEGDRLAILSAGAYGFTMASNYNSRPFVAEVLVNGKQTALVRKRQPVEKMWALEKMPQWKSA
jgi:diaminopimelate decarboxylase